MKCQILFSGKNEKKIFQHVACCKQTLRSYWTAYRMYPKYSDRQGRVNSVDPDQTLYKSASDQGITLFTTHPAVFRDIIKN